MSEQLATSTSTESSTDEVLALPAWAIMVGVIVFVTIGHVFVHHHAYGVVNVHQAAFAFFLAVNLLVNFWELGLYFTANEIREEYLATREDYAGRPLDRMNEVFAMRVPLARIFAFKSWTAIWSSYALFDPGYTRKGSYGYNIDVGNGFSTLVPAALFAFGMTYEIVSARMLGIIGVAMFWQMLYGTIVYFAQFFANDRHVGHSPRTIALFVGSTNGLWFIFPIWGIAVSIGLIESNTYELFR